MFNKAGFHMLIEKPHGTEIWTPSSGEETDSIQLEATELGLEEGVGMAQPITKCEQNKVKRIWLGKYKSQIQSALFAGATIQKNIAGDTGYLRSKVFSSCTNRE